MPKSLLELLRSYRVAHARVSNIDQFEAVLRENTPVATITDPSAFVDYITYLSVKSDMIMVELKKVSIDRDALKVKALEADKKTQALQEEIDSSTPTSSKPEPSTGEGDDMHSTTHQVIDASTNSAIRDLETCFNITPTADKQLSTRLHDLLTPITDMQAQHTDLINTRDNAQTKLSEMEQELAQARTELQMANNAAATATSRNTILESLVASLRQDTTDIIQVANDENVKNQEAMEKELHDAYSMLVQSGLVKLDTIEINTSDKVDSDMQVTPATVDTVEGVEAGKKKSKNKKKKKATTSTPPAATTSTTTAATAEDVPLQSVSVEQLSETTRPINLTADQIAKIRQAITKNGIHAKCEASIKLLEEKIAAKSTSIEIMEKQTVDDKMVIDRINSRLKDEEGLRDEIESLRDDISHIGNDHVAAKDQIKTLQAEKENLTRQLEESEKLKHITTADVTAESKNELELEITVLKDKLHTLQTDLTVANELSQTRYKDLTATNERLGKLQPELRNLQLEMERLKKDNDTMTKDSIKYAQIEARSEESRIEVSTLKSKVQEKEIESRNLTEKLKRAEERVKTVEESEIKARDGQTHVISSLREATEVKEKLNNDLQVSNKELEKSRKRLQDLESQLTTLRSDTASAKNELQLRIAQQTSAQTMMDSMQDQAREMAMQMKEVRARCDSLEEELADSQRLLMERSREGETMRRLLADVEGKADAKVKEMRERLDLAVEERDRAEEDASSSTRRRAREVEELRNKLRDAEHQRSAIQEEKEDLNRRNESAEKTRAEFEKKSVDAVKELDDMRLELNRLGDAMNENERQIREFEKERNDLKRSIDDKDKRLDKVQQGSKVMADELKALQNSAIKQPSTLSSTEPSRSLSLTNGFSNGDSQQQQSVNKIDYVYLKNVLLQFMEQKDKKHQMQLVPVLGMLLQFDK